MRKIYIVFALFYMTLAQAQNAADLDLGFNTFTPPENQFLNESQVLKVLAQSDGKLIVLTGKTISRVSDNKFDTTFNTGTGFIVGTNNALSDFAIDADGKIIVVGYFTGYDGTAIKNIIRLNNDGSPDASFVLTGTGITSQIEHVNLLPDGKILLSGMFGSYNGIYKNSFIRLNADGSLDSSFSSAFDLGSISGTIVRVQPDNKILVCKKSAIATSDSISLLYRLNSDGSIDDTFTYGDITYGSMLDVTCQSDGKIVIIGTFLSYNSIATNGIMRVNADGSIDSGFNGGLIYVPQNNTYPKCIVIQPDGKLIVGGTFTSYNNIASSGIVRINTDGSRDTTFDVGNGFQYGNNVGTLALMTDGKVVAGGSARYYDNFPINFITRINSDGSRDITFTNFGKGLDYSFDTRMAEQTDGKILLSGMFGSYNDTPVTTLIRLNIDGSLDSSFSLTGSGFSSTNNPPFHPYGGSIPINSIVVQPDGKILIGGIFTAFNGTPINKLLRFNSDGSFDASFTNGSTFTTNISRIVLQPDGKILIRGGTNANIIRLNSDGTLDFTFQNAIIPSDISDFHLQSDGKILVEGNFTTTIDAVTYKYLMRLNSNGTLDSSFHLYSTATSLYNTSVQLDGKILFITNTGSGLIIRRINSDGTLDNTFTYPVIGYPYQFLALYNGKILVSCPSGLKRLNANGTVDINYGYDMNNGFDGFIDEFMQQQDGKVLIIGGFKKYRDIVVGRIARLMGESAEPLVVQDFSFDNFFTIYPNPANDQLNIDKKRNIEITSLAIFNTLGQLIMTIPNAQKISTIDVSSLRSGNYFLRINSDKGISNTKFIKL